MDLERFSSAVFFKVLTHRYWDVWHKAAKESLLVLIPQSASLSGHKLTRKDIGAVALPLSRFHSAFFVLTPPPLFAHLLPASVTHREPCAEPTVHEGRVSDVKWEAVLHYGQ